MGRSSGFADLNKRSKQPLSWLKWGADLRLRNEAMDNTMTLSSRAARHDQNYFRVRPRLFGTVTAASNLELNVRLTVESREWWKTSFSRPFHEGWDWNEVVFDHLNVKWKNPGGMPLTLQVGRMDLSFGDNWLVFEGTPLDGSRTIHFDAARASYEWRARKTTLDLVYVDQGARNDRWLPPIRIAGDAVDGVELPVKKAQIEQNERGAILYATNRSLAKTQLDGYFIYKGSRREDPHAGDDPNGLVPSLRRGDEADLYTLGARAAGPLAPSWKYRAEGAFQAGDKNGASLRGFGWNSAVSYAPKARFSPELRMQYEYLSGDDPSTTGRNEGFDILWGRWPRWSELYIYSYAPESRISQLGNLHRVGPGLTLRLSPKLDWTGGYHLLFADKTPLKSSLVSGKGRFRGQLVTSTLKARFNPWLSGHVWAEDLFPGSFYSAGTADGPSRRDTAVFLRAELMLAW